MKEGGAPLNCFASTVIASLTVTHTVDLSCVHTRSVRFPRRRGGGGGGREGEEENFGKRKMLIFSQTKLRK